MSSLNSVVVAFWMILPIGKYGLCNAKARHFHECARHLLVTRRQAAIAECDARESCFILCRYAQSDQGTPVLAETG